jgi:hypothetical protein
MAVQGMIQSDARFGAPHTNILGIPDACFGYIAMEQPVKGGARPLRAAENACAGAGP